jgi:hypothetical protein
MLEYWNSGMFECWSFKMLPFKVATLSLKIKV